MKFLGRPTGLVDADDEIWRFFTKFSLRQNKRAGAIAPATAYLPSGAFNVSSNLSPCHNSSEPMAGLLDGFCR